MRTTWKIWVAATFGRPYTCSAAGNYSARTLRRSLKRSFQRKTGPAPQAIASSSRGGLMQGSTPSLAPILPLVPSAFLFEPTVSQCAAAAPHIQLSHSSPPTVWQSCRPLNSLHTSLLTAEHPLAGAKAADGGLSIGLTLSCRLKRYLCPSSTRFGKQLVIGHSARKRARPTLRTSAVRVRASLPAGVRS